MQSKVLSWFLLEYINIKIVFTSLILPLDYRMLSNQTMSLTSLIFLASRKILYLAYRSHTISVDLNY